MGFRGVVVADVAAAGCPGFGAVGCWRPPAPEAVAVIFQFRNCKVVIDETRRRVETRWPDGQVTPAIPVMDPESIARARDLGYAAGSDEDAVWWMTREHDLLHTMLAEARGAPFSAVLHSVAHGYDLPPGRAEQEERIVLFLQRLEHFGLWALAARMGGEVSPAADG